MYIKVAFDIGVDETQFRDGSLDWSLARLETAIEETMRAAAGFAALGDALTLGGFTFERFGLSAPETVTGTAAVPDGGTPTARCGECDDPRPPQGRGAATMTTPGTTLIEELERAAERAEIQAQETTPERSGVRWRHLRGIHLVEASRLRQRAAWVRELLAGPRGALSIAQSLTGPDIPSTAAPETVTGREARPGEAECRVCGKRFPHPSPGTGGTWTCSDACRRATPGKGGR